MNRVAIVGLGQIGMTYDISMSDDYIMSYCRAFSTDKRFSICAGIDVDPSKRMVFESNFNAPFYDSVSTAMIETAPSILVVSVDTTSHLSVIETAVTTNSKLKYILCEKPFGASAAEAKKINELCDGFGISIFVNYMRYSVRQLREGLSHFLQNSGGSPINGVVTFTGSLLHSGSHFLQLLLATLHQTSVKFDAVSEKFNILSGNGIDIVFACSGVNGKDQSLSHYEVDLVSGKGRFRLIRGGRELEISSIVEDEVFGNNRSFGDGVLLRRILDRFQSEVVAELYNAIEGQPYYLCDGYMGLKIHNMCEGIRLNE